MFVNVNVGAYVYCVIQEEFSDAIWDHVYVYIYIYMYAYVGVYVYRSACIYEWYIYIFVQAGK